jgi:hypothetical protein
VQHVPHDGQEGLSRLGELSAVRHAMEERGVNLIFQILDLLAQRRLPNADLGAARVK